MKPAWSFSTVVALLVALAGTAGGDLSNVNRWRGQASFDTDNQGTVLQVVRNPTWLTPYFACVLVGAGLVVQFLTHLVGFAAKRKVALRLSS